jgi:hypothetical protein
MSIPARILAQIDWVETDERGGFRCERCKTALGVSFFDCSWVCDACREVLIWKLSLERSGFCRLNAQEQKGYGK